MKQKQAIEDTLFLTCKNFWADIFMEEEILTTIANKLNEHISKTVKETLEASIEKEVRKALGKALSDGEFYQSMTNEVQSGLTQLINEIQNLKNSTGIQKYHDNDEAPGDIFHYAADKLSGIYSKTEDATFTVMDIVEKQIDLIAKADQKDWLSNNEDRKFFFDSINNNMVEILTALSFQDIIGQQIKKVIEFIKNIEEIINKLYVSHNLMLKSKEANPDLDCEVIKKEVQEKISQKNIDALLAEYGID
ncbi:MAG: protein phosphatase CheZ [Desulforegulaceae bacterium]|nr:protein phosphatase CheZ [Desulforegulaceae bacterium]